MPFRITTKNVLQFTWRRRTVDSAKEKLKGKFLKNIDHDLFTRGQVAAYLNSYRWLNRRQMEDNVFLFWLYYKRNGKRCSCTTMELWMHLGGLLSTQEARDALGYYASFVLSNLPRASITPWLLSCNVYHFFYNIIKREKHCFPFAFSWVIGRSSCMLPSARA